MKNPIEHIREHASTLRLTADERARMRAVLMAHMRLHPVAPRSLYQRFFAIPSPLQRTALRPFAFAAVLLLAVGGTTTFAAEGALPGDTLYPLKVNVVEPTLGAFQVSDEARASWKVRLLDRRLSEASTLATKEDLNTSDANDLSDRIAGAAEEASITINALNKHDPVRGKRLAAELQATIELHAPALLRLDAALMASSTLAGQAASTSPSKREKARTRPYRTMTLPPHFFEGLPGYKGATSTPGVERPATTTFKDPFSAPPSVPPTTSSSASLAPALGVE